MLTKSHFNNILGLIHKNYTNIVLVVVYALSLFSVFGLGMKNYTLSYTLIILLLILLSVNIQFKRSLVNILGYLVIFGVITSIFINQTPYGFYETMTLIIGILIALFFSNNSNSLALSKVFLNLSILNIPISFFSIYYFLFSGLDRSSGLFLSNEAYISYPNAYASMLLFLLVPQFYLLYKKQYTNKFLQYLYWISFFINLCSFWLTFSRGAYLSLFFGIAIVFAYNLFTASKDSKYKQFLSKTLKLFLVGVFTILLSYFINLNANYPIEISQRLTSTDISSNQSRIERFGFWQKSFDIFLSTSVFGNGPGSFEYIHPQFQNEILANAPHPHNFILKVLLENGVQTAVPMLLLLIYAFHKLIKTKNILLLATFVSANIHLAIDYNLNFPVNSFLFFMILGLSISAEQEFKNHHKLYGSLYIITNFLMFLILILQVYGFYHIKLLETQSDLSDLDSVIINASIAPFPHQLYSVQANYVPTQSYPNFHPAIYNQALNEQSLAYKQKLFQTALQLNYYNDISYHYSYLNFLTQSNQSLQSKEAEYKDFTNEYLSKLATNSHNTVATENPSYMLKTINLFLQSDDTDTDFWSQKLSEFLQTYNLEKTKFEKRFSLTLPAYE